MIKIFKLLLIIIFVQKGFAQSIDLNLISQKVELNRTLEPKMSGIKIQSITYYIEKDLQTLSAYENGIIKWQTNITAICGKPNVGKSEIRVLKYLDGKLFIVLGKHSFAEVNIHNGQTNCLGSD